MFLTLPHSLRLIARSVRTERPGLNRRRAFRPGLVLEDRLVLSTLTVTTSGDDPTDKHTLRYAVAHAQNGDTIQLTAAIKRPIVLTNGELVLNKDVTIESVPSRTPTISGNGLSRVFEIAARASVSLINLNLTGGDGIANNPGGSPGDEGNGGAVLNYGTLKVSGCTLSGNSATANAANGFYDFGGAIFNNNGTLTVTGSTLSSNTAVNGGGISEFGAVTITGCTLSGNIGTQVGGGITLAGTVNVTGSTLTGNSATYVGGGVFFFSGTLTVIGSTLSSNSSAVSSGGIFNFAYGVLTVSDCALSGNSDVDDSGGSRNDGMLTVSNSTLTGNTSVYGGGGIFNEGAATVTGCTFSDNTGGYYGAGGILNDGAATVTGCTFSDNTGGSAGGILNSGTLYVGTSDFSDNTPDNIFGGYIDLGGNTFM